MKTYICVGYPDEENVYQETHTEHEIWECQANSKEEAEAKAFEHFYYFHDVYVKEKNY